MHVGYNEQERVLVYRYFRDTFLSLLRKHPKVVAKTSDIYFLGLVVSGSLNELKQWRDFSFSNDLNFVQTVFTALGGWTYDNIKRCHHYSIRGT